MKKLFAVALLIIGITAFAQEKQGKRGGREKLSTEQKVDLHVKKMTEELNLNEKQIAEVRAIATKQIEKREAKKSNSLLVPS